MKNTNHEMKNLFVPFLTGMALAVVLGSTVALSTPAFAMGGGGGGGSAPAPKVTQVDDPVAKPKDEVAEVKKLVVDPEDKIPVGESKTREPEEKTLVVDDPDEDKTETKPDERTVDLPETKDTKDETADVVKATVGFAGRTTQMGEGGNASLPVVLSKSFPQPVTVALSTGGDTDALELSLGTVTFRPGETSKVVKLTAVEDADSVDEKVTIRLSGSFPNGVEYGEIYSHIVAITDDDAVVETPTAKPDDETGTDDEDKTANKPDERTVDFPEGGDTKDGTGEGDKKTGEKTPEVGTKPDDKTPEVAEGIYIVNEEHVHDITVEYHGGGNVYIENTDRGIVDWDIEVDNHGDGEIEIINDGIVDWDIEINNHGNGGIEIVNRERVEWDIEANHHGDGIIDIINEGIVNWDIDATHKGDDQIRIENLGTVDWDIEANHHGNGSIYIKNASKGLVRWDIDATHHSDNEILIENWGIVDWDIEANHRGNGGIEIANYGTVDWDIEANHHGNGGIEITNHETVNWDIEVTHDGEGSIDIVNHGYVGWGMDVEHNGGGKNPDSTISIANLGTVDGDIRARHLNGSIYFNGNINGERNRLEGRTVHIKNAVFEAESFSRGLEIIGDYEGSDETQLDFHAGWNRWSYGKLVIDGDVTGQSRVSLIADEEVGDFTPVLIEVDGEAQADNFYGKETVGAFDYVLHHNFGNLHTWRFVRDGFSDAADQISRIPGGVIDNIVTPSGFNPDEREDEYWCLWGEQLGSHTVLGFDVPVAKLLGGNMFVGTSVAQNLSTSNNISVDSQITALTTSWEHGGLYVGAQTRFARFISDVSTNRLSVVQNNEGTGINMSMEMGYRLNMMNFQIVPQAQLTWTRVGFDDFVGPHGELVSLEDGDRVTGRLGLSWDSEWQDAEGFGRFYGGMNLRGAVDGTTSVNVSGVSIANEQKGLSVDGKLGLSYEWDEGYAVHGEVSALRSDDVEEVRANLGVRIDF